MTLWFIRIFFLIISGIVGYQAGLIFDQPLWGIGLGCGSAVLLILLEANLRRVSVPSAGNDLRSRTLRSPAV